MTRVQARHRSGRRPLWVAISALALCAATFGGCASTPRPTPLPCMYPQASCTRDADGALVYADYFTDPKLDYWELSYSERDVTFDYRGFAPQRAGQPVRVWEKRSGSGLGSELRYDLGRDGTLEAVLHIARDPQNELVSMVLDRGADGIGDEQVRRDGRDWVLRSSEGRVLARVRHEQLQVRHSVTIDVSDDGVADGRLEYRFDDEVGPTGAFSYRATSTRRADAEGGFDMVKWQFDKTGALRGSDSSRHGNDQRTPRCTFDPPCTLGFAKCEQICAGRAHEAGNTAAVSVQVPAPLTVPAAQAVPAAEGG